MSARTATRSFFATRIVYAWERPAIMRKHIYTGAMGNIWATLIGGMYFVYFGTVIGMSPFQWGVMASVSSWVIVAQILSARIAERTGRRKLMWFWFAMADRVFRFAGIVGALFLWRSGSAAAGTVLITAICVANFFGTMGAPPWLSWLADIIPEEEHGRFWGRRAMWVAVSSICVIVPAGFIADRIPEEVKIYAVAGIFAGATLVGVIDLLIHGTIPEPMAERLNRSNLMSDLLAPLKDIRFRPWIVFNTCWTFSMTFGGALSTVYFVNYLGIRNNFLGGAIVLSSFQLLGTIITGQYSGKIVDRLGVKHMLSIGHFFWALLPLFWFFAEPGNALVLLGIGSLLGGSSSTAAANAANKLITRFPPPQNRATYIAVSTTFGSVAGGVGVFAAGLVLTLVQSSGLESLAWTADGYRILFIISAVLRMASALLLLPRIRQ